MRSFCQNHDFSLLQVSLVGCLGSAGCSARSSPNVAYRALSRGPKHCKTALLLLVRCEPVVKYSALIVILSSQAPGLRAAFTRSGVALSAFSWCPASGDTQQRFPRASTVTIVQVRFFRCFVLSPSRSLLCLLMLLCRTLGHSA